VLVLTPGAATMRQLEQIYRQGTPVQISPDARAGVERAEQVIARAAKGNDAVYGVNTGFGKLAKTRIAVADTEQLQRNLILSHASGVGQPLAENIVRLMMSLKLLSLGRGSSGTKWETIVLIQDMLKTGVVPLIPGQGSVGASGDLAPLAHLAAVMIGEGEAFYNGERVSGKAALKAAGLTPIILGPKEGIAMINGTQTSTALALAGLFDAWRLAKTALVTGALSTDAAMGSYAPFRAEIQALRGHKGQIDAAATLRDLLENSDIRESHRIDDERVQDPYCLRCQPQVMGACIDLLRQVANTLHIEANAVTDNPLIVDNDEIISGGNFHAEPVAFAADQTALAISEIGAIAQRRIALMVDPTLSFGLPAFLTPNPGLNSGFMIAEVTSAALMSENKQKANPCSVDSTPTSANQEDHVSMACHAARRLLDMNDNLAHILGIELLCAVQGVELRGPLKTSPKLEGLIATLRQQIPSLMDDRYMSPELVQAGKYVLDKDLLTDAALSLELMG
jgi:histidine ammonia-lyase